VYDPDTMPDHARKLCLLGYTDKHLADFFGVNERTINRWKLDYPEFCQSIAEGKEIADGAVAESMYKRACGYDYEEKKVSGNKGGGTDTVQATSVVVTTKHVPADTRAASLWLRNRQPDLWRDNKDVTVHNFDDVLTAYLHESTDTRDPAEPRPTQH